MVDFPDGYLPVSLAEQFASYVSEIPAVGSTTFVDVTGITLTPGATNEVLSLSGKGRLKRLDCVIKPKSGSSLETLKDIEVYTEVDGSGLYGMNLETLLGLFLTGFSHAPVVITRFDDFSRQYGVAIYRRIRFDSNFKFALKNPYGEELEAQILCEYEIYF